jgi:hypothetical protein
MKKKYYKEHKEELAKKAKERYEQNKEVYLERNQKWKDNNKIKMLNKMKEYYDNHKEEIIKNNIVYYKKNYNKNREKIISRSKTHYLIEIKPCCEICGSTEKLERHHWRYDKPEIANTLCKECHQIQHTKKFYQSKFIPLLEVIR